MADSENGAAQEPAGQSDVDVEIPLDLEEIVTIPNSACRFTAREDGSAILSFILPSGAKAYQILLDPEGRQRIGRILLGPSVQTYGLEDIPHAR